MGVAAVHAAKLLTAFCGYVCTGVELFAGKLVASNTAVAASAYGVNDYYVNNFDDLVRAGQSA